MNRDQLSRGRTAHEFRVHRSLVGLLCTCAANPDRVGSKAVVHLTPCPIGVVNGLPDLRWMYAGDEATP